MRDCIGNKEFIREISLNFIRLPRIVITPAVTPLLRGENDSKISDEIQANVYEIKCIQTPFLKGAVMC